MHGFVFLGLLLFIAAIPFLIVWQAARRTKAMAAVAAERGWRFTPEAPDYQTRFADYSLFQRGRRQQLTSLMTGTADGLPVEVFDYQYAATSSNTSHVTRQTVVHVDLPGLQLPRFQLYPETVAERLAAALGSKDVDLPEHPAFSRLYVLNGPDEQAIRHLFTGPLADYFSAHPRLTVVGDGAHLFVHHANRQTPIAELPALIEAATETARLALAAPPAP